MKNESVMVVCAGHCERLMDTDHMSECPACGKHYCGLLIDGKACSCACNPQPTGDEALVLGMASLDELGLALKSGDTAIVQDEFGTAYGSQGPCTSLQSHWELKTRLKKLLSSICPLSSRQTQSSSTAGRGRRRLLLTLNTSPRTSPWPSSSSIASAIRSP